MLSNKKLLESTINRTTAKIKVLLFLLKFLVIKEYINNKTIHTNGVMIKTNTLEQKKNIFINKFKDASIRNLDFLIDAPFHFPYLKYFCTLFVLSLR